MPKAERISLTFMEVCKKYGIDYTSVNPECGQMINDARRLGEIYLELKVIAGDLEAIADRNNLKELKGLLHDDAIAIEKIDHELIKIAKKIQKENA